MSPSTRAPAHLESAERADVAEHAAEHESVLHLDIGAHDAVLTDLQALAVEDIAFELAIDAEQPVTMSVPRKLAPTPSTVVETESASGSAERAGGT